MKAMPVCIHKVTDTTETIGPSTASLAEHAVFIRRIQLQGERSNGYSAVAEAARKVFFKRYAIVNGPTPPGTGVMALQRSNTSW